MNMNGIAGGISALRAVIPPLVLENPPSTPKPFCFQVVSDGQMSRWQPLIKPPLSVKSHPNVGSGRTCQEHLLFQSVH
jgi:hypothetical protein